MAQPIGRRGPVSRLLAGAVDEASGVVENVIDQIAGASGRVIKRYSNRKLYDTTTGAFTTLTALQDLLRSGVDVRVVDHETGVDLTQETLGQIADRVARADPGSSGVLSSFIRSPNQVARAIAADQDTRAEVKQLRQQVEDLTALVESLRAEMAKGATTRNQRRKATS